MKKNFRGALICLFILALMGLGVAGVANAATVVGTYSGVLSSDLTDEEGFPFTGPIFFKVGRGLGVAGSFVLPNTFSLVTTDAAFGVLAGTVDADGVLTATAVAGDVNFTFNGTLTLNEDTGLFEVLDGTYTSEAGDVTGTWFAVQQTVKQNKGNNGFYLGTFAINGTVTGHAIKGRAAAVVVGNQVGLNVVTPAGEVLGFTDTVNLAEKYPTIAAVSGDFDITGSLTVKKMAGKIFWTNPDTGKRKQVGTFSLALRP